ncbi:hypothetical protein NPIL_188841 [Nephila pilipes]|uniref:Uncharacterized protein n=1 Tax=Nephila pilipes TaxID=299642 RepID=A0A8X6QGV2_NEPPI|nr:hypothetical protein NPIL_188841 [Nephila pilipes]
MVFLCFRRDPNIPDETEWPPFKFGDNVYLELNDEEKVVRSRPDNSRCEFWRDRFQAEINDDVYSNIRTALLTSSQSGLCGPSGMDYALQEVHVNQTYARISSGYARKKLVLTDSVISSYTEVRRGRDRFSKLPVSLNYMFHRQMKWFQVKSERTRRYTSLKNEERSTNLFSLFDWG